jgi:hypothetical protein
MVFRATLMLDGILFLNQCWIEVGKSSYSVDWVPDFLREIDDDVLILLMVSFGLIVWQECDISNELFGDRLETLFNDANKIFGGIGYFNFCSVDVSSSKS